MNLRTLLSLAIVLVGLAPAASPAQTSQPMPLAIAQGLDAYAQNGLNSALEIWAGNTALDRATLFKSEVPTLRLADANFGLFDRGEVLRVLPVTAQLTRVYVVLYYERAPLWGWFDLYTTRQNKQAISEVFFSPKLSQVLPSELLFR